MGRKLRVGVVFGGRSGEHEVSLVSARSVLSAIDRQRYDVVPIGITREGRWITGDDAMEALEAGRPSSTPATLLPESIDALDVIFPVLHGPMGEDGTLQGLLELVELPYVGCGVLASAVGMDKAAFKDVMRANGVPVVEHVLFTRRQVLADTEAAADQVEAALDYPVFCKPANMGSSVGVVKASSRAALLAGLLEAARWDRRLIVERGVDAREIEVSVLGNDAPEASVAGEIRPCNDFYDYAAKYQTGDDSELCIPAPLPQALSDTLRTLAVKAFSLVDGAGLARVDFLLERGTDAVYLNEINTLPGFTPISMYPKLWAASGISYPALIEALIQLALERHAEKRALTRVFDV